MLYEATFTGRTKGAIGVGQQFRTMTEGDTEEAARLSLYDRYEHITGLKLEPKRMSTQERFAQDHAMPIAEVKRLVALAKRAGDANTHSCNGDPDPSQPNASDKNFNSQRWSAIVDDLTQEIAKLVKPYGFTEIVYTGLGPTLKIGERFVEVPY